MIDITKIIETNKEYVKQHPELPKAGLTSHPTKGDGLRGREPQCPPKRRQRHLPRDAQRT